MKSKIKIRRRRRRQSRSQKGLMTWTAALHARQQMNRRGVEANHPKTPSSPEILVERGDKFYSRRPAAAAVIECWTYQCKVRLSLSV